MAEAPELDLVNNFYYRAYVDLTTCRLYEGGPIPYHAISDYAVRHGIDDDETDCLATVINSVDAQFRAWWKKENKDK